MAKTFHPKVLTANDLIGGHSVFLTAEGWSPSIVDAMVAVTPDHAKELEASGNADVHENTVIGPYLVDVSMDGTAPQPLLRRERIRADGRPSIDFLGTPVLDHAA